MKESTLTAPAPPGQTHHPVAVYLKVWGWLFVLSVASYLVDVLSLEPRWMQPALITVFALVKSTLIVNYFMHLRWERLGLVYVVLGPIAFILLMVAFFTTEAGYVAEVRRALSGAVPGAGP